MEERDSLLDQVGRLQRQVKALENRTDVENEVETARGKVAHMEGLMKELKEEHSREVAGLKEELAVAKAEAEQSRLLLTKAKQAEDDLVGVSTQCDGEAFSFLLLEW